MLIRASHRESLGTGPTLFEGDVLGRCRTISGCEPLFSTSRTWFMEARQGRSVLFADTNHTCHYCQKLTILFFPKIENVSRLSLRSKGSLSLTLTNIDNNTLGLSSMSKVLLSFPFN